jgi:serine phosphatase RsbU (regulator of sigma subunit)
MMFLRLRIRSKLLLAFCLILLPLTGIMAVSARRQWQQRTELIFEGHREMAAAIAAALQGFLQNFAETQEAMGIAARFHLASPEAFHTYITRVARANPHLLGYAVTTPDGKLVNSDPPSEWWGVLRDSSDLEATRSGHRWGVSDLQRTICGAPVITIATPLPGSSRLLRAAIDVRALDELLGLPLRTGWRVVIVDHQGRLVYHSLDPDRGWEQRDWSHDPAVWEARSKGYSRRDRFRSRVDGRWCLGSYQRVGHTRWIVGSLCPVEAAMAPVRAALVADCLQGAMAAGASLLLILFLGRRLSLPIERLAAAAARLGRGESSEPLPENGRDELAVLAHTFNTMAAQVQAREQHLRQAEQSERQARGDVEQALRRERTIAGTLQQAFLPQRLPECPGYRWSARYHPALQEAEVGGDFYDVFPLTGERFGVLLGDVSGKGLLAAVCATETRYMVRAYALEVDSPAEVLARVNQALWQSVEDPGLFVTAFYAVLDPTTHTLCYANAGHWPALLARERGTEIVGGSSLALCIAPDAAYNVGRVELEPGDTVLLYTDGLIEVGSEDPVIHFEAVQERLGRADHEPPELLMEGLFREAVQRSQGRLRDDVALLMLRRDSPLARRQTSANSGEMDRSPDSHPAG